jgi:hypothetical protein
VNVKYSFKNSILLILLLNLSSWSAEEVRGANLVLELEPAARNGALGGIRSGSGAQLGNMGFDPSSLMQLEGRQFEVTHSEEFGGANWDWLAYAMPLDSNSGVLGVQFGRYAVDGIYRTQEGVIYEGNNIPTFSIADYYLSLAWSKTFFDWDMGLVFHTLYRQLGQDGYGLRLDYSLSREFFSSLRFGLVLEAMSSSIAQWESGYTEYAPPEFYPFASWVQGLDFFYGDLILLWQGPGLVHSEANRLNTQGRSGLDQNFTSWLGGSQLGAEFITQSGLILRSGLENADDLETWAAGVGFGFLNKFQVDYSLENHPELQRVHRISLTWMIDAKKRQMKSSQENQEDLPSIPVSEEVVEESVQEPEGAGKDQVLQGDQAPQEDKGLNEEILEEEVLTPNATDAPNTTDTLKSTNETKSERISDYPADKEAIIESEEVLLEDDDDEVLE